ncbi:hypothetical protein BGW38_001976, partial [Lunasporangiospora selenospora]
QQKIPESTCRSQGLYWDLNDVFVSKSSDPPKDRSGNRICNNIAAVRCQPVLLAIKLDFDCVIITLVTRLSDNPHMLTATNNHRRDIFIFGIETDWEWGTGSISRNDNVISIQFLGQHNLDCSKEQDQENRQA